MSIGINAEQVDLLSSQGRNSLVLDVIVPIVSLDNCHPLSDAELDHIRLQIVENVV